MTEQREMFNPQPSLLEEQEEEINDKSRRFLNRLRQSRRILAGKGREREVGQIKTRHFSINAPFRHYHHVPDP